MAEFLSPEWIRGLDQAAMDAAELADAAETSIVVEFQVTRTDGSTVAYHLRLGPGPARVGAGVADHADLMLVTTDDAADAMRRGVANAQQCLADGSLRLRGNPEVLTRHVGVLAKVGDLFAAARR